MRIARIVYYVIAVGGLLLLVLWSVTPKFHDQHDIADVRSMFILPAVAVAAIIDIACFKELPKFLSRRNVRKGR